MNSIGSRLGIIAVSGFMLLGVSRLGWAQDRPMSTQMIRVNGRNMRIQTGGLEQRRAGQPVVILESGLGSTSGAWKPVLSDIARLGPVLAYDRSGLGESEFDNARPTLRHVGETLHALLQTAHIAPPYVLVGHSWGGAYIRGFADLYPIEVVGVVFLEATDFERTREEEAAELPLGSPEASGSPPQVPDGPPGTRAEVEQLLEDGSTGFAALRAMRLPTTLPIAVVVGGALSPTLPPGNATTEMRAFKRLQIKHQAAWVLASRSGLFLMSSQSGHYVMADDPALVLQAITHVLKHAGPRL